MSNAGLNGRLAEPRDNSYKDITTEEYAPIGLLVIMLGTNNASFRTYRPYHSRTS